jgi:hypothetical protein
MICWHPQNKLEEKVTAIDTQTENTEEKDLAVALDTSEYRPVITGPYVWLELVYESLKFALAWSDLFFWFSIDPVKLSHVQIITCHGTQHNTEHIASKDV